MQLPYRAPIGGAKHRSERGVFNTPCSLRLRLRWRHFLFIIGDTFYILLSRNLLLRRGWLQLMGWKASGHYLLMRLGDDPRRHGDGNIHWVRFITLFGSRLPADRRPLHDSTRLLPPASWQGIRIRLGIFRWWRGREVGRGRWITPATNQ